METAHTHKKGNTIKKWYCKVQWPCACLQVCVQGVFDFRAVGKKLSLYLLGDRGAVY